LSSSFADLGVSADAVRALDARGITAAFPIQTLAIPPALDGKDVCGKAPTGSGKTIAFGLPVAARVERARPGKPRALVLAPTRELAGQIEKEMGLLMGGDRRRRVAAFYGGVGFGGQLTALRRGVDIAVACPGRLRDLIARGAIGLADVSIVVIDEADRMADMGFLPEVKAILDQVRPDRQTLLFSATLDGDVDQLVRRYQRTPVKVSVEVEEQPSTTTHHWVDARREDRVALAANLVASHGPTVVFCRTKYGTDRVARQLVAAGVSAVPLHGGRTQAQRDRALRAFVSGQAQALVATDVAARGIHVDDVGCVVHFDLPATAKDYVHRSGRTGRAGSDGVVVTFVTPADREPVRVLQKAVGHPVSSTSGDGATARPAGSSSNQSSSNGSSANGSARNGRRRHPDRRPSEPRQSDRRQGDSRQPDPRQGDPRQSDRRQSSQHQGAAAGSKPRPKADRTDRTGRPARPASRRRGGAARGNQSRARGTR
jgi:superfamily II DNA/RNA helicase